MKPWRTSDLTRDGAEHSAKCVSLPNLFSSCSSSVPLFALHSSSSSSPLPSLFWARLSRCCAARRKDTLMLSLLSWHSGTSLWGARALTLSRHQLALSCWLVLMLLSDCCPACLSNKLRMEPRWPRSDNCSTGAGGRWIFSAHLRFNSLCFVLFFFFLSQTL